MQKQQKFTLGLVCLLMMFSTLIFAQDKDKSKRPSPPAQAKNTTNDGVTITIDYSSPSVKGREV